MNILDTKTHDLLTIIVLIPEKFKDVLILESDEIDNFDIGFESFYLLSKDDIEIQGWELLESPDDVVKKLRQKYFVSINRLETVDGYSIHFFKHTLISQPHNMLGETNTDLNLQYNWKIQKNLRLDNF